MPSSFFELKNISKYFGSFCALRSLSFAVNDQEVFGLLGPNGAGKTTLIKSIFKLLKTSNGEIFYKGKPLSFEDIYAEFGYLPENFTPPRELSGKEFLGNLGLSIGVGASAVNTFLEKVKLDGKKRIKHYSRGMVQRLGLATALLKDPAFVILDEPMLGLDPIGQHEIMTLIKDLRKQGKTIFFSSHNLSQVEKLCDRIGVIYHGELEFVGAVKGFIDKHKSSSLEEAFIKGIT